MWSAFGIYGMKLAHDQREPQYCGFSTAHDSSKQLGTALVENGRSESSAYC